MSRKIGITGLCLGGVLLLAAGPASASLQPVGSLGGSWNRPMFSPGAVAFGSDGGVLVLDQGPRRVIRLGTDRETKDVWPTEQPGDSWTFEGGVAVDGDDNVYVAASSAVDKYSPGGDLLTSWELDLPGPGSATSIVYDQTSDTILLRRGSFVQRLGLDGQELDLFGGITTDLTDGGPIAVDDAGNVFTTGTRVNGLTGTKSIYKFDSEGDLLSELETPTRVVTTFFRDGEQVLAVAAYSGLVPRPGGGMWVMSADAENLVTLLSPTGAVEGGWGAPTSETGSLFRGPDGHFWIAAGRLGGLTEFAGDGTKLHDYEDDDFPKYSGTDRGAGLFSVVSDVAVAPDGDIYTYDDFNARFQRFGATGSYEAMWDGPVNDNYWLPRSKIYFPSSASTGLLNSDTADVRTYSNEGAETSQRSLQALEPVAAVASSHDSGLFVLAGEPARISRLDASGEIVDSWSVSGPPELPASAGKGMERNPAGNLVVQLGQRMQEYTVDGVLVHEFDVVSELPCRTANIVRDFGIDGSGRIHVLVDTRDDPGNETTIVKYSPTGKRLSEDIIRPAGRSNDWGRVAVSPNGDVLVSSRWHITRFVESNAQPEAPDLTCKRRPRAKVSLQSITYSKGRRWARAEFYLTQPGTLRLTGARVRHRSKTLGQPRLVTMAIVPKPGLMRPVARKSRRFLRLRPVIRFSQEGHPIQHARTKVTFERKVRRTRRAPHR
ncbi:MAG: hypothetical protein ACSLFD_10325 [Solirubrobacterales bacterium]